MNPDELVFQINQKFQERIEKAYPHLGPEDVECLLESYWNELIIELVDLVSVG